MYKDTIPVVKTNTTDVKNRREHTAVMFNPTSAVNANDFLLPVKCQIGNFTKCLNNQPCNAIKMREMRGEVGDKPKRRHMTYF